MLENKINSARDVPPKDINKSIKKLLVTFLILMILGGGSCFYKSHSQDIWLPFNDVAQNLNSPKVYSKPYVILISLDGFRFDYVDLYPAPFLKKFRDQGASADLLSVFPSKTFTNHYSIITGLYAEHHGIVDNFFYDPQRKAKYAMNQASATDGSWYGGNPLWVALKKQGMNSAILFWPGSEAEIQGVRPEFYFSYRPKVAPDFYIEQALHWLRLPEESRPHFITLYFPDVDAMGHRYGPNSPEVQEAILKVDQTLQKLHTALQSLNLPINLVIVSDHGMEKVDPANLFYLDQFVSYDKVEVMCSGPQCLFYALDDKIGSHQQLQEIEQKLKHAAQDHPFQIYRRDEMPPQWHYSCRPCGDLVLSMDAPHSMIKRSDFLNASLIRGNHGYDPDRTLNMKGIFYAQGPHIKNLKLEKFRNVHIYPFLLNLLQMKPISKIDGDEQVLKPLYKESKTEAPLTIKSQ